MATVQATTPETVASLIDFAIGAGQPLVVLYNTNDVEAKARVIYPYARLVNKRGELYIRAHDSLRNDMRSFAVRRILSAHHLTAGN